MLVRDLYDKLALNTGFPVYTNETDCPDINRFLLESISEGLLATIDDLYLSNNVLERNDTIRTVPEQDKYGIEGVIKNLQLIDGRGRSHSIPYNDRFNKDNVDTGKPGMPRSYVIKNGYLRLLPAPDKAYVLKVCISTTDLVAADNDVGRNTVEDINDTILADNRFCHLVLLNATTLVFARCQSPNMNVYQAIYERRLKTYLEHDIKTLESQRGFTRGAGHYNPERGLLDDGYGYGGLF